MDGGLHTKDHRLPIGRLSACNDIGFSKASHMVKPEWAIHTHEKAGNSLGVLHGLCKAVIGGTVAKLRHPPPPPSPGQLADAQCALRSWGHVQGCQNGRDLAVGQRPQ